MGVTVAIVSSLEVNLTDLSVAVSGDTVADSVSDAPTVSVVVVLFNVTPDGSTLLGPVLRKSLQQCRLLQHRNERNLPIIDHKHRYQPNVLKLVDGQRI